MSESRGSKELQACPFCGSNDLFTNPYMNEIYKLDLVLHKDNSDCPLAGYGINRLKWQIRAPIGRKAIKWPSKYRLIEDKFLKDYDSGFMDGSRATYDQFMQKIREAGL